MKPKLHKLPFPTDASFLYKKWNCEYFSNPWHFHKEFELVLINKSRGTRFIGDHVGFFEDGDLCFIGSNVPHLYRNSEEYYSKDNKERAESIFIHFTKDFLGHGFFDLPEMQQLTKLLDRSSIAVSIKGRTKKYITAKLKAMESEKPAGRLLSLLDILITLSHSHDLEQLLARSFTPIISGDSHKIDLVFQYLMKHYTEEIYIHEIASKLHMSVAAFSRYFKHHTRKTFSDYLTEIRIGHACRMLMENNHSISEISHRSGFDNLSNFYRHFKKVIGIIPKEYKNRFLKTQRPE